MKIGHIEINVQQYADGRWGFDDYTSGQRRAVRLWNKQKAEQQATEIAVLMNNGRKDLLEIDQSELREFLDWKTARDNTPAIAEARKAFVTLKSSKSSRHTQSLERDLRLFETFIGAERQIGAIMAPEIQSFLDSRECGMRRKANLRSSIVALFRWARRMSYLPERTTEAEKVEGIQIVPGEPNILLPDQMRALIENVREEFLPWLYIGAFAGIRSEEIAPDAKSKKTPLKWEDFDWAHNIIIVRAQTAKTREEREVPILPNLAEWLTPWRHGKGPVLGDAEQPSKREATRVGKFIGGWKHNCLRDSFCSYRARITRNVPQVSYEMGNSIAMVRRSYHRRQPIQTAQAWFDIRPDKQPNVVRFSQSA